jgi:GT2 family glycosyltransferase
MKKFALIICTFQRPGALKSLLDSIRLQRLKPHQVLIVDGSHDLATREMLTQASFREYEYYKVSAQDRGLTKQRNYGIARVGQDCDIVCFLDDDTVLEPDYFAQLITTYDVYPEALGVGGYITNEASWKAVSGADCVSLADFCFDGYRRKDGSRFILRKRLGLDSDCDPGRAPEFSHGRSIGFLPPSGKIYPVDQFMGGVSSFRKSVFEKYSFSTFFEGYGLYEDADFTLRLSKSGPLYVNTAARLAHYHDAAGRPNQYSYGKMVVRNGWYVWRVANPSPGFKAKAKWHLITILLMLIRFSNVFTAKQKRQAFTEAAGRLVSWITLFWNPPVIK